MPPTTPILCSAALKEWAVAIDALGTGRQSLIIRKGGIREQGNRFEVAFPEFLLFPSFEHQQRELLRHDVAREMHDILDDTADPRWLTFTHFARVQRTYLVAEAEELDALAPFHIWTPQYAEKRLRWRPKVPLTAMVLRTYELPTPKRVEMRHEYAGCKSWLPLLDTVTVDAMTPALTDYEFEREASAIDEALSAVTAATTS